MIKRLSTTLFILIFLFFSAHSQQLTSENLRDLQIEKLTDQEIADFYTKAKGQSLSDSQIFNLLITKGLPESEITKLQTRLQAIQLPANPMKPANSPQGEKVNDLSPVYRAVLDSFERQIFGMELFSATPLSFEPDIRIATPANYVLGPDDELLINVFGYSTAQYRSAVSPEGNINIPGVGPIYVNGLTIAGAKARIVQKLSSTIYRAINTGATQVDVTLTKVRSIRVIVIGQAKRPGTYTISSLSTLMNLLYLCGGPSKDGSFRNIQLIRGGERIRTLDLYSFLHSGDNTNNVSLHENDVIRIPFYEKRIKLAGEFKRPGYFELRGNETLGNALDYAGGFSDSAYKGQLRIVQVGGKQRKIEVISTEQIPGFIPISGDEITAEKISSRYSNRITVMGAVNRPGQYDFIDGLTAKQLINKADGIKEDAFLQRGTISRLKGDLTRENIAFDVKALLNNNSPDIPLQLEDILNIPSVFELRDEQNIIVEGQVRKAGKVPYRFGMTVKDAILSAGGFTEAATGKRLEIGRRVLNSEDGKETTQIAEVIIVDTEKDLGVSNESIKLQPSDIIIVRNNPGYFAQKSVTVNGEVKYTGKYVIGEKNERLSDIIARAGGLTNLSDAAAASLERINLNYRPDTSFKNGTLSKLGIDSANAELANKRSEKVGINLLEILGAPHSSIDVTLEDGDVITIPKKDAVVRVRGEVLVPSQLSYIEGQSFKFYISRAGGFSQKAMKRKSFVLSANGNAKRTKSFLFFKKYPEVAAGDEIYVPKKADRTGKLSTAEVLGIATTLTTLLIAILK